jgi:hypothetical protein
MMAARCLGIRSSKNSLFFPSQKLSTSLLHTPPRRVSGSFISEVFGSHTTAPIDSMPTTLFADNQSAIALAKEQQYHADEAH